MTPPGLRTQQNALLQKSIRFAIALFYSRLKFSFLFNNRTVCSQVKLVGVFSNCAVCGQLKLVGVVGGVCNVKNQH